jgi:hypothetical protein
MLQKQLCKPQGKVSNPTTPCIMWWQEKGPDSHTLVLSLMYLSRLPFTCCLATATHCCAPAPPKPFFVDAR